MIQIFLNDIPEIRYVAESVFKDFMGVEYHLNFHDRNNVEILLGNGSKIVVEDHFFSIYKKEYLKKENIPQKIKWLKNDFTQNEEVPVLFGDPEIFEENGEIVCKADLFAGVFFMLSRWEEHIADSFDQHGRFKSEAAIAVKYGFIEKPIVNQYVEIIWRMIRKFDGSIKRNDRDFLLEVSHDIDIPFMFRMYPWPRALKKILTGSLREKSPGRFLRGLSDWLEVRNGNLKKDPFFTYDLIMDISDENALKSTFFFLSGIKKGGHDGCYDLKSREIRSLISHISERGHFVGLHGSYGSFGYGDLLSQEFSALRATLKELGIDQKETGSRQHFLRWRTPETFQNLEDAGVDYDTTLTYADRAGFRCGICYPYRVFNILTRKVLNLVERPLIVMDCTLTASRYMDLTNEKALEKALQLKAECRKYNGVFSLLWHNTEFVSDEKVNLYREILKG